MRVRTHLVAMPWAPPEGPSIQIASLKGHLDRALGRRADCRVYSAFFSIPYGFRGRGFKALYEAVGRYREYGYMALYLRRFGPTRFRDRRTTGRLLKALRTPLARPLSLALLGGLERATCRYLDRRVGANLIATGLNLVGFTLNYDQVYASLYAAEYLRRRFPERHFLFVYGGCRASLPDTYRLLCDLEATGVVVIGEGERKLELLVRTLEGLPRAESTKASVAAAGLDPGIIVIGEPVDLRSRDPVRHAMQVQSLSELTLPDYDEYFTVLKRACADERTYAALRAATPVGIEGSRGCFGRCDFCGLNRTWNGFRTRTADDILRATSDLVRKYRTSSLEFVDSVCDAWAEDYARLLLREGIQQRVPMELRAGHPEEFWTLLALAGVASIQVGIEALSSPLLRAMGKGTSVVQNLTAHKYLSELGIRATNNLILHHPASTVADVRETGRILEQIPHWSPFDMVAFALMPGSPLYEGLSREERAGLRPVRPFRLPSVAARYALDFSYELPERLEPPRDVRRAWSALARRYERTRARHAARPPRVDVVRVAADTLRITDTRGGSLRCHDVSGPAARVYDACHRGSTLDEIARATELHPRSVMAELVWFLRSKLVLRVDDHYLSLATRRRDELICRFFAVGRQSS